MEKKFGRVWLGECQWSEANALPFPLSIREHLPKRHTQDKGKENREPAGIRTMMRAMQVCKKTAGRERERGKEG